LETEDFLAHVLPQQGYKFAVKRPAGKEYWVHEASEDSGGVAAAVAKAERLQADIFFACASFDRPFVEKLRPDGSVKKTYRTQSNAAWVKSLWLDLDCGEGKDYPSQKDALTAVVGFCKTADLQLPTIVNSGRGLHCYWVFDRDISAENWVKLATAWRAVVDHFGLRHDASCTTDVCRILRPVGTNNRKSIDDPKAVKLVGPLRPAIPVREFAHKLKSVVEQFKLKATPVVRKPVVTPGINDDLAMPAIEYPPADADEIARNCNQVAQFKHNQGDTPEPLWYAMLGLLKHAVNGEQVCHDWSEGYAGYAYSETQQKIEQWEFGPPTCARLCQLNASGCAGCVNEGKVKSPIQLGVVVQVSETPVEQVVAPHAAPDDEPEIEAVPAMPENMQNQFAFVRNRLVAYVKDEDDVRKEMVMCDFMFYPRSFHTVMGGGGEKEISSSWVVRIKEGVYKYFSLPGAAAGVGGRELFSVLGNHAIFAKNGTKKLMEQYVSEWFSALRKDSDEVKAYATYGWHGTDFLIGTDLYHPDGTSETVRLHGDASKYEAAFTPSGTLDTWVAGVNNLYNREGHEQYQWMLGTGFGAPLVKLLGAGMAGCVINGYSPETALGKSTAGKLALGMYGNPDRLALTKQQSTTKGLFAYCGVMNSLPVLLDEITNAKPWELSEMVYTFSQGTGRLGAQSDGSLRTNVYEWATLMASTANRSVHTALSANKMDSRPEIARVFEYKFKRSKLQMPKLEADNLIPRLLENSGVAGRVYMQYIVTHREQVKAAMAKVQAMFTTRGNLSPDDRFWLAGATATLTGLIIAKKLGLHSFEITKLTNWVLAEMANMRVDIDVNSSYDMSEHVGSMLNEFAPNFLVTSVRGDGRGARAPIIHQPKGELVGRVVHDEQRLWIPVATVRKWCDANQVDYRQMIDEAMVREWGIVPKSPFSLGVGTADYATAPARCLELDLGKIGALAPLETATRLTLAK